MSITAIIAVMAIIVVGDIVMYYIGYRKGYTTYQKKHIEELTRSIRDSEERQKVYEKMIVEIQNATNKVKIMEESLNKSTYTHIPEDGC